MGNALLQLLESADEKLAVKQRIAQSTLNKELNKELCNLRETLVAIDKGNTQSMDTLSVHTEKISNVVQKISTQNLDARQFRPNPFHIILSVGTLSKTEIPLDVLMVWFGLCCLMTPGLSKDIRCHV